MAYFSRLIASFLFLFISGHSFAACPEGYQCQPALVGIWGPITEPTSCPSAASIWGQAQSSASNTYVILGTLETSAQCRTNYYTVDYYGVRSSDRQGSFRMDYCPSGWSFYWDGSKNLCRQERPPCAAGETANPETGVCEKACPPAGHKEGDSGNAWETTSKVPANNLCIQGCSWSAGGTVPSVCANGKCYYFGPFTSNGSSCTGQDGGSGAPDVDPPDQTPPDDAQCVAKGQCPGTINGTKVCVPCSSKEGTTSESGSSSGSGTDSSGNSTGGTGTTNTTKETTANCTNGSCNTTTTVTVTAPDGSTTTTTETESVPQKSFCAENPGHVVCKGEDEGTFGGSCASGFQCSGDAVQCAQAQAAWKSACAADVSGMSDQINTGSAAMTAGAASGLGIPGGSDVFDLGSRLSEVPLFGSSGGCPSDVSVNVGGTSYTIAFSAMCGQLQVLGVALMGFAYLIAGFIVFRGDRS